MSPIKFPTKLIFPNFHILNINRMMSFCNLFMQRPSYYHTVVLCFIVFNLKKMSWSSEQLLLPFCFQNDIWCVKWDVKPYCIIPTTYLLGALQVKFLGFCAKTNFVFNTDSATVVSSISSGLIFVFCLFAIFQTD